MTLEDLANIPVYQTAQISEVCARDPDTLAYITNCLIECHGGNFGIVPPEDTAANMKELEAGAGHVLARYKKAHGLRTDVYINIYFDKDEPDNVDYNNALIMYVDEY
jgi:hypothetical protein